MKRIVLTVLLIVSLISYSHITTSGNNHINCNYTRNIESSKINSPDVHSTQIQPDDLLANEDEDNISRVFSIEIIDQNVKDIIRPDDTQVVGIDEDDIPRVFSIENIDQSMTDIIEPDGVLVVGIDEYRVYISA